jgi:hypothetical protein
MWLAGGTSYQAQLGVQFLWGTCAAWLAIALDPRFIPGAIGYFAAFMVAARWPEAQLYATSTANMIFSANLIVLWRPGTWIQNEEERAWLAARAQARRDRTRG